MGTLRTIDVVIPVYQEMPVLPALFDRLGEVFSPSHLSAKGISSARIIFVDDGSSDGTPNFVADRIRKGFPATLLCLSRNFGHQAAIAAGIDHATADVVAVIDADLQDPPELILEMSQRIDEGFDIVYGQRRQRQEAFPKRVCYWLFYRICSLLAEVHLPVDAGEFCVMTREVVLALRSLPEKLRFQRGLRSWIGFRQNAFLYDRSSRALGVTKYTWSKLYALATDGITSLSIRPLRITQVLAFVSALMTFGTMLLAIGAYLKADHTDPRMIWFLATPCLVAFASSLQLFCLYVFSAYIGRMYLEVKARPSYVIMRTIESTSATE